MKNLVKAVMQNEGITEAEAVELVEEARQAMYAYLAENDISSAYDVCEEYFGLEPDYLFDLL